ncbi:RHS repeat-associated core domain-containing protein [Streptomyces sp. UG1]|uniref:RHS repeat-associated core domain-containing protein n=1 Tax=Streptomyces sp. UG1 TaxID=3417652 RepID=UPI003CF9D4D8
MTATNGSTPALGYQSGWTDPDNGDVNMAARWYQPGAGAFSSRDTWLLDPIPSSEANRYTYVGGDPLGSTDPTGHIRHIDSGGGYASTGALGSRAPSGRNTRPRAGTGARAVGKVTRPRVHRPKPRRTQRDPASTSRPYPSSGRPVTGRPASRPTTSHSTSRPNYGTAYRGNTPDRPSGTPRTSPNVRPPKPPTPQNPNRGSRPTPAPVRPAPKPRVDVARMQRAPWSGL